MIQYKESPLSKRIKYFGIPCLGILLTFVIREGYELFTTKHVVSIGISTTITALYWLSCNLIVRFLWHKYPWHISPLKHLITEIALISLIILSITTISVMASSQFTPVDWTYFKYQLAIVILLTFLLTCLHEAIFFYFQWQEHFKKSAILEKSNISAKYETLKNQVNPHFLFNSLNTLLSHVEKNEIASNYIENLSDFLRYTLNSCDIEIRKLEDEIEIIKKYFSLQQSRFGKNINLEIRIETELLDYCLPPLSLQMLVENSIKHNVISKRKPLSIKIFTKDKSYIVVENNLQKKIETNSTKRGLNNIIARYKFLSSKDVNVIERNDKFIVELPLLRFSN